MLKDTLALILAKTPEEKDLYDEAFELYFKRDEFAGKMRMTAEATRTPTRTAFDASNVGHRPGGDGMGRFCPAGSRSVSLLESDDRFAGVV